VNIINTLTLRSLKLNRKRTIVTIIGIILSTAMICGTITLSASFQDLFVQIAIKTDGNFHATFYGLKLDQTKYITDNPYTKKAVLSRNLGYALFEQSTSENKPYFFVKEYDAAAFRQMPVQLTAGRFPEKAGEVLISEEIPKRGGKAYQIGETIAFNLGERINEEGQQLPDDLSFEETEKFVTTGTKTYTITGYMAKPHFEMIRSTPGFTVIGFLDPGGLIPNEAVNVSILGKNPRQIYDRVPEMAKKAGARDYDYNSELLKYMGISKNENVKATFNSVTAIVIILILVGSVTVIYNAFAISVSERKKQFGMLASTGATPRQIRRTVFFEGALLGLAGIPLGILSGVGGIGVTLSVVNRLISDMISMYDIALRLIVSPGIILATIAFVGLIIFISAYLPAVRASATSPIEAIRLSKDIKIKGKTVKTSRLTRFLWGIEGELALKNLKRNRRRYRATVVSLFISIVLFISFSSFITYAFKSTGLYYQDIPYNLSVVAENASAEQQKSFYERITDLDEVERYAVVRENQVGSWLTRSQFSPYIQKNCIDKKLFGANEDGHYQCVFHITALGDKEFKTYTEENGLDWADFKDTQNLKGILINKSITHDAKLTEYNPLQIKAGEKLLLEGFQDGEETDAADFTMEVGAVTDSLPLGVSSACSGSVKMIVSEEVFAAIDTLLQKDSQKPYDHGCPTELYLCTKDSTGLAAQIRTIFEDYDDQCSLWLYDVEAEKQDMERGNTVISIFLYGFITLITLIGVTNIFNTISTNVALRRREFAILQSMGLTPKGFNKIINYESIFYGLKALLYGLPVSILISVWMYNSFGNMFEFAFILPWKEILYCVAGVFVIIFITMLHASAKLKNDNIVDALRGENL
jgi:putative ABC transport system permease protein